MDFGLPPSVRPGMTSAKKVRAQPIGISAAPNMTGQARGEGGKDGRPPCQSATAFFVPWPAAAPRQHASKISPDSDAQLGENQETSERLTQTNSCSSVEWARGPFACSGHRPARWRWSDGQAVISSYSERVRACCACGAVRGYRPVPRLRRRPFWQVRGEQPPPLSASRRPLPKLTCHLARACGHPRQTRRAR